MNNRALTFFCLCTLLASTVAARAQAIDFSQFNYDRGLNPSSSYGLGEENLADRIRRLGDNPLGDALPIGEQIEGVQLMQLDEAAKLRFSFDPKEAERGLLMLDELNQAGNPLASYLITVPTDALDWTQADYLAEFDRNQVLAEQGQPLAQRLVATDYLNGTTVPMDLERARQGFDALSENPQLGELDTAQQIQALQLAAEANQFGIAGEVDLERSAMLWKRGIKLGDPLSMVGYSDQLLAAGGADNLDTAFSLINRAAGLGDTRATIRALSYAAENPDRFKIDELLSQLSRQAPESPLAALAAGDYFAAKGQDDPAQLQQALVSYSLDVANRPMSQLRLGDLLLARPELGSRERAIALLRQSAASGVADAVMSLAEQEVALGDPIVGFNAAITAAEYSPELTTRSAELVFKTCEAAGQKCLPVPVLFATDRALDQSTDLLDFANARDPKGTLRLGVAYVYIPISAHESEAMLTDMYDRFGPGGGNMVANIIPEVAERLSLTDWTKYPTELALVDEDPATFFAWAKAQGQQQQTPTKRALVFIHGFNTNFFDAVRRAAVTAERSGFPGIPIVLSWSSAANVLAFPADVAAADLACADFRDPMMKISKVFGPENVSLVMHSAGNVLGYSIMGTCSTFGPWTVDGAVDQAMIDTAVFAAPALPEGRFKQEFPTINKRIRHAALYVSEHDIPLQAGQTFYNGPFPSWWNERMAGQGGDGRVILDKLQTIDASAVESGGVAYGMFLGHSYVFDRTEVADDLQALLEGRYELNQRSCLRPLMSDDGPYSEVIERCGRPN